VIFQHTVGEAPLPAAPLEGETQRADTQLESTLAVSTPRPEAPRRPGLRARFAAWSAARAGAHIPLPTRPAFDLILFGLSLLLYLALRLIRLSDFPIYFFTDEAVQTVLAADFVRDGFRDFLGNYFPTYFQNVYRFNLSTSVYAQVIPYMLFGKSVFVTRATAALLTLPGAIAVGLALRDFFRLRLWWIGVLLFSAVPAWFLHSRTAFETTLMVSFYACFLYFYLRYRLRSPTGLYLALLFGALAFYTYSPGQIIVPATGALLLISDFPYHRRQRKEILRGVLVLALLALPYLRFYLLLPEAQPEILRILASPWAEGGPLAEKILFSLQAYARGISPAYWFWPHEHDLPRHTMLGYGHMARWMAPFALIGLVVAVRRWRDPAFRAVLACLLAIPFAGSIAGAGITRLLSFVVPATMLATIGLDLPLEWLVRRAPRSAPAVAAAVFLGLAAVNLAMLRDALVNGPTWNRGYGMEMQYGASQLFGEVSKVLAGDPAQRVLVSPTWGNGIDVLERFFIPDDAPVQVANADGFLTELGDLSRELLFVLTPEEYAAVLRDPKLTNVHVEETLPYPDGRPGFYFVRMEYSDQAEAAFAREREARSRPVEESLEIDGETYRIEHSVFDSGELFHVFDKDPYTLARGMEANPLLLDITLPSPRNVSGLDLTTGSMDIGLAVALYHPGSEEPMELEESFKDLPDDPTVSLDFPADLGPVQRIRLLITQLDAFGPSKIHLRELTLR
jgi:4-amino-4-deoxy-L-arabinose transferase-like glycosyltransferase